MQSSAAKTVIITVLDAEGDPVIGAEVTVVGLERSNIEIRPCGLTGDSGRLVVNLVDGLDPGFDKPCQGTGWGVYRFVVKKPRYGWAVSDFVVHGSVNEPPGFPQQAAGHYQSRVNRAVAGFKKDPSTWAIGRVVDLTARRTLELRMKLTKGITIRGRVVDPAGNPIEGARVLLQLDLAALSHTGLGAELEVGQTLTDPSGEFAVEHVGDFLWWLDATHAEFPTNAERCIDTRGVPLFVRGNRDRRITFVLSKNRPYSYFGTVRNKATGGPISSATVWLSWQASQRNWGYEHLRVTTDSRGEFSMSFRCPSIYRISADAYGYRFQKPNYNEDVQPGRHDIDLEPLPPDAPKYFGCVKDRKTSAPIPHASVEMTFTDKAKSIDTWAVRITADGEGCYKWQFEFPTVVRFRINAQGYAHLFDGFKPEPPASFFLPGRHDFLLEPLPPPTPPHPPVTLQPTPNPR